MTGYVDAHHHIWRLKDLDWLKGPTQPRIFGNYDNIKCDYLIENFLVDLKESNVKKSVYIQVNWPNELELLEAKWVQNISEKYGWPHAIVGYADFSRDNSIKTLKKLSKLTLVRGIRQQLHWHENPQYRFQSIPNLMNNNKWQRNFSYIQEYDWSFELQVFSSQMRDAARFASKFSETKMILQHCGMPEDTSKAGMAQWHDGMKRLAELENIYCKFSGLGTFINKNDPAFISEITGICLELFSSKRCLFGSNFPIEKIWTDYNSVVLAYKNSLQHLSDTTQLAIMRDNASIIYKI